MLREFRCAAHALASRSTLTIRACSPAVQQSGRGGTFVLPTTNITEAGGEFGTIAAAEQEPAVARLLEGKRVVKRIHVPDRIVNFVVAG